MARSLDIFQGRRLRFMLRNSARLASSATNLIQAALNRFMQSARSAPWPWHSNSLIGMTVSMPPDPDRISPCMILNAVVGFQDDAVIVLRLNVLDLA
jgi:hypothetical protein